MDAEAILTRLRGRLTDEVRRESFDAWNAGLHRYWQDAILDALRRARDGGTTTSSGAEK